MDRDHVRKVKTGAAPHPPTTYRAHLTYCHLLAAHRHLLAQSYGPELGFPKSRGRGDFLRPPFSQNEAPRTRSATVGDAGVGDDHAQVGSPSTAKRQLQVVRRLPGDGYLIPHRCATTSLFCHSALIFGASRHSSSKPGTTSRAPAPARATSARTPTTKRATLLQSPAWRVCGTEHQPQEFTFFARTLESPSSARAAGLGFHPTTSHARRGRRRGRRVAVLMMAG